MNLRKALFPVILMVGLLAFFVAPSNTAQADDDLTFPPAVAVDGDQVTDPQTTPDAQEPVAVPACAIKAEDFEAPWDRPAETFTACVDGMAGIYPCSNIDLMATLPLNQIGGGNGNDIWGWSYTDPTNNAVREFALMGRTTGTAFIEVTDALNPVYLGNLPSHTGSSSWRDIKTYEDHAYIVSDSNGNHGMQVFDLMQLLDIQTPPVTFTETAHYGNIGSSHNVAINEDTGYAYIIGGSSGTQTCNGGLHMVNIQDPENPTFAGCFSQDGYTHDTQCVVYNGPDTEHVGAEICFSSNEDTLTVTDVTDKANPVMLSRTGYTGSAYSHQGWLTEDQAHFLLDDELDEGGGVHTSTFIWDMTDLENPVNTGVFEGTTTARDHNQYIKGDYSYQANYRAGLRIVDISDITNSVLDEVGYFDIYPANDGSNYNGSWSNYPYFASGNIIISGIEQGLVIVRPTLDAPPTAVTLDTLSTTADTTGYLPLLAGMVLVSGLVFAAVRRRA